MSTGAGSREPGAAASISGYLNGLSDARAQAELLTCCASPPWVAAMVAARPFATDADALAAAERAWWALAREDWLEAFTAHPRIGDRVPAAGWSSDEQAGVRTADAAARAALAAGNADYEARFGHVFLICASGREAGEMLAELRRRLTNDAGAELREAAGEQAKITRLRLQRLVAP